MFPAIPKTPQKWLTIATMWASKKGLGCLPNPLMLLPGARGGTRTPTAFGHRILNPARLPVPPLSHGCFGLSWQKILSAMPLFLQALFHAPPRLHGVTPLPPLRILGKSGERRAPPAAGEVVGRVETPEKVVQAFECRNSRATSLTGAASFSKSSNANGFRN